MKTHHAEEVGKISTAEPGQHELAMTTAEQRHAPLGLAYPQTPSEQQSDEAIDPKAILSSLRRRWFLACLLGTLGGMAAAIGAWKYVPAPYRAFSELKVSSVNQKILFTTSEAHAQFDTYKQTQSRQITSPFVLNAAIRDPEVAKLSILQEQDHPVDWLEENLQVDSAGEEFIRVSLEGDRPSQLAKIVNAVVDAFLEEIVNKERNDRQDRLRKLEEFNSEITEELRTKRAALRKLAESLKTTDPETLSVKRQMEYQYIGRLREEATRLRFELLQAQIQLATRENQQPGAPMPEDAQAAHESNLLAAESIINERISLDPEYRRIEAAIRDLGFMVEDRLQRLGPKHPELVRLQNQLTRQEAISNDIRERIRTRTEKELQATTDSTTDQLRSRVQVLQVELDHLNSELNDLKLKDAGTGTLSFELEELQRDIALSEQTGSRFRTEIEALTIEIQAPQRISLHRKAEVPHVPETGKKYKMSGMAGMGVFGLIAGGIIFLDYRRRRVSSIEEVSDNLRVRILGAIPLLPRAVLKAVEDGSHRLSSQHVALRSVLKESMDSARAVLLRDSRVQSLATVMVTSASDGEGKTSVACHLATSLARAGRKVVLVDCDLRRPTVHRVYGVDISHGFCEILRGEKPLEGAAVQTAQEGLSVIPAGHVNRNALQMLAEGRAQNIFKSLHEDFEFVVLDTAPVLPVSDSLLLAQDVDSVILTIRRDVSRMGNIAAAKQRLEMVGVPPMGAILIGLDDFADRYGYYSRHYNSLEVT